jgi:hypothetical protein
MIPITIIDDFFENPNMVLDLANSLTYEKDKQGRWPGKRSELLHIVAPDFFHDFCGKMFAVYYNVHDTNIQWNVRMNFQKIDNSYKEGWVHQDSESILTAMVYLNKNSNYKSGTSIMAKKILSPTIPDTQNKLAFLDQEAKEIIELREAANSQYEECVAMRNKYNRFVAFPAHLFHKAQDFDNLEERLTLIAFVQELYAPKDFLSEMRKIII